MVVEWPKIQFAKICEHSAFGPRFSGECYAINGNVATLRTTDISEDGRIEYGTMPLASLDLSNLQQHILHEKDLVITRSGRVGTTAVFDKFPLPVLPGAFLIRFRLKFDIADPFFYRYFFNSSEGQDLVISTATGSVQQNLNISSLHMLEVPQPPLEIQHRIAHILGSLDDKIELNRQMNATLEAMARAIFQSWFVDFDPVRAKAEGRQPAGMDAATAALFPDSFDVVEGREVPRGWGIATLAHSVRFVKGKKPDEISDILLAGYEQQILIDTFDGNDPIFAKIDNNVPSSEEDVLMVMDGASSGRVEIGFKGVIGSTIAKLEITNKIITPPILYYYLKIKEMEIRENTTGTSIPHADRKRIEQFEFVIPNNNLYNKYSEFADVILDKINHNKKEVRTLAQIRDTLLPKLMSGEIQVPTP